MKNRLHIRIILGSLLLFTNIFALHAQNLSTKGKDFWIGFMRNAHETDVTLHVYISADFPTTGTISIPLGGWSQSFTVSANSTTDIIVPDAMAEPDQNQINLPMGIHVVTDTSVSVFALNYESYTADASVIIPTPSLGYDYYVVSNIGLNSAAFPSEFTIVSLTDNTIIQITPSAITTNGDAAGTPFNITLNAGEIYQVQEGYYSDPNGELTGTRVKAIDSINCHKFALFAGSQCSFLPANYCCCDQLYDEMVPINKWGKNYYTVPLASRLSDFIRVVASVDNTNFTIDGGSPITLNAGQWYDYTESTATVFSADQPVSVAQYSPSLDWDNTNGDPFMIMIDPIEQHENKITFNAFTSYVITNYYLNVVTPTAGTAIITLDGSLIGAVNFHPFANDPNYSYAQLDITQGNHTLESDSGFTASVYGFGGYESFGYGAGAGLNVLPLSFDIVYQGDTINYLAFHDTVGCPGFFSVIAHGDTSLYSSFQWDFGDGTFGSGATVEHTYNANGTYTITLSGYNTNQCAPDQVSTLVIEGSVFNLIPSFNITYDGNTTLYSNFFDTLLCNYTVDFSALSDSLAYNYYWDFGNGATDSGLNVTYTFDSAGTYIITLHEKGDSCHEGFIHWTIVVGGGNNLNPYFNIVYNGITTLFSDFNTTIGCRRELEFIGYSDPAIVAWNWSFGDGTTGSGQDVTHIYNSPGDYIVTMSTDVLQACLDTTISRTIHIVDSISVDIPDMPLCYNATIIMQATTSGNPNLQWSTGSTSSFIQIDQPGTYFVTATLDQCLVSDTAVVTSIPKIENFLPALDSVCTASGKPATIGCNSATNCDFSHYVWNTGDTTSTIDVDTAGFYSVTVIDANGCIGADTEQVVLYCPPFVIFPSGFSPNEDGVNDGFGPEGLHIVTITFTVYNRWGQLVYTGGQITDRWNGKYKNTAQPVDVYVYTCSYTTDVNPGVTLKLAGNVTLVR